MRLFPPRSYAAVIAAATAVVVATTGAPASAAPTEGTVRHVAGEAIKDSYIVVLKEGTVARSATGSTALRLAGTHRGRVGHVYSAAFQGFEVSLSEADARRLAADPAVDFVEQNAIVSLQDTQFGPPNGGLDRIDQPSWPLDGAYTFPTRASGIRVYVIDSGIRASHTEFAGRVAAGADFSGSGSTDDCLGHGTHVAGIAGGTTFGVAKGVTFVPVRVFGCGNSASNATVAAGVDWVTADHDPGEYAVANMSLGGPANSVISLAVDRSINDGVVYSVAAGNANADACGFSPANMRNAIVVGATAFNGSDSRATFSNFGGCVDVFAPGQNILSAWNTSDTASMSLDGTSMATPFATGIAALIWSMHPSHTAAEITADVSHVATHGVIPGYTGAPNRHVFVPTIIISGLREISGFGGLSVTNSVAAAGGAAPYTWSATGLPPAITINPSTGTLSGRLSVGTYTVTVTATDAAGRAGRATATWYADRLCLASADMGASC